MSGADIVWFDHTGHWGTADLYRAWAAAGRPPINSCGRLYAEQKELRTGYVQGWRYPNGEPYAPADDPDDPGNYELAHVRGVALDINGYVGELSSAGLVRPFSYEPWHWRLPGVYNYPLVHRIPASAGEGSNTFPTTPTQKDDDMYAIRKEGQPDSGVIVRGVAAPYSVPAQVFEAQASAYGLKVIELADWKYDTAIREQWVAFNTDKALRDAGVDQDDVAAIIAGVNAAIPPVEFPDEPDEVEPPKA